MPNTLLLVEDDAINGAYLAARLERLGYRVLGPLATGEEALALTAVERPDLVLMDVSLAGEMDGVMTAELLRARHDRPVIFLTAHADPGTLERAKSADPFGYLTKPFQEATLKTTIEVALYKHALTQQLSESEARYHIMADHTADWEYWIDPSGHLVYCSPSCAWVTGRPPEAFLADPNLLVGIIAPDDQPAFAAHRCALSTDPGEAWLEFRVIQPDGSQRWLEHICRPVTDPAGRYRGRRVSNRDITRRKTAETALRRQSETLRGVAEAANLLVADTLDHSTIKAALESLGRTFEVDRVYVFRDHQDPISGAWLASQAFEWARSGIQPEIDNPLLQNLPYAPDFATWPERLLAGQSIAGLVAELPEAERDFLAAQFIQSIIVVPIQAGGVYWGHLGLDDCRQPREWSATELVGLQIAAISLGSALERQAAEAARRRSEALYQQMFVDHSAAKLLLDPETGAIVQANPAAARFYGYSVEALQQLNIRQISALPDEELAARLQASAQGRRGYFSSEHRLASGAMRAVDVYAAPIQRGGRTLLYTIIHDVTERRQAEQSIAEERVRLRALISASRDGIVLIGLDQLVYVVNAPALLYLGLSGQPETWEGRRLAEPLRIMADQGVPAGLFAEVQRIRGGDRQPAEGEWQVAGRILRWISQPVQVGPRPLGWLLVLRDVTNERQAERLREDLTRTMVHDLRNPLNSVYTGLQYFRMNAGQRLAPGQEEALDLAFQGVESVLDLVAAILDVSRLESGKMPVELMPISMMEMVDQVLRQQAPLAADRQMKMVTDLAPNLPAVHADGGLLFRVLQNLVGNALKFTPPGGTITVSVAVPAGSDRVWVRVSDTGPGIAPELQAQLFQKFVTGRVPGHGSGLGLAFCRQAVEAHGGRLWVESAPGQGAVFTFTLASWTPSDERV